MTEAVILIPGIMGSVLQQGKRVVWPGSPLELVLPYKHMKQLLNPNLQATDVIRRVSISSQYDNLLASLEACGFKENGKPPTLVAFPYDWRKDNALAAQGLAGCIDTLVAQLGSGAEINLIAHSMGGLVSRCYLESGLYDTRPGFAQIKRLITMGTPHRGSPLALGAARGNEKRLFLSAEQVKTLASDPNFPALYQLLPPKGEPYAWDRGTDARFMPMDVFDPQTAADLGLVGANLAAADKFHRMLDLAKRPAHVRYFCFVGTRQTTTNAVQITLPKQGAVRVVKVDCDDAGDGTVPIWSASQSGLQMEPVGGEHGELYKTAGLKAVLAVLLDKPGLMLAAGPAPEISVRTKVVTPGDEVQVTIDFPHGTVRVKGALQLRRVVDAAGISQPNAAPSSVYPVLYEGPAIDHLAVLIDAPDFTGIYELGYVPDGSQLSIATTELFVQGT